MKKNFVEIKKEEMETKCFEALMKVLEYMESEDETVWPGDYGHPTTKWFDKDGNIVAKLDYFDDVMTVYSKYEEIEED